VNEEDELENEQEEVEEAKNEGEMLVLLRVLSYQKGLKMSNGKILFIPVIPLKKKCAC